MNTSAGNPAAGAPSAFGYRTASHCVAGMVAPLVIAALHFGGGPDAAFTTVAATGAAAHRVPLLAQPDCLLIV